MADDVFKQFGGRTLSPSKKEEKPAPDPFAQFGGQKVQEQNTQYLEAPKKKEDPFKQFGGEQVSRDSVQTEIEDRSFFDKPILGAEYTKKSEVEQIARKHGVDPSELESLAPYFGARLEDKSFASPEEFKRAAGGVGQILLNLPQKAYKKYRGGEMEKALDELQNLAAGRQSYTQFAGEVIAPLPIVAGKAASLGGKIAGGVATGAAAGYGTSSKEQELPATLAGAALGGAISGIAGKLGQRVQKTGAPQIEKEVASTFLEKNAGDIEEGTQDLMSKRAKSEKLIDDAILGRELSSDDLEKVVQEQLHPDTVNRFLNSSNEEGRLFQERVLKKRPQEVENLGMQRAAQNQLADDIIERRAVNFARDMTEEKPKNLEDARRVIEEYAGRQGEEATRNRYRIFTEENAALEYIDQKALRIGRGDNFQDKALNFISDAQFVLRDIDDRFGTSIEPVHRKMNQAYNRLSFARNDRRAAIADIYEKFKGIDDELVQGGRVYDALDSGDISKLSKQELGAYQGFKQFFNDSLDYVNGLVKAKDPSISPMAIPKRENYIPHILLSPEDLTTRFEKVYNRALEAASVRNGRRITDLAQLSPTEFNQTVTESAPVRQFLAGLHVFDNKEIKTGQEAMARMKDLLQSREGRRKMETVAKAALERSGSVPEWMREKNLYKLADRWTSNTLKHLYLRKSMDELRSISKRVLAAGGDLESDYLNKLLQDINGTRKGTAKEFMLQKRVQYQTAIDKATEGKGLIGRAIGAVAKSLPEVFSDLNRQIYPNMLGLSPRALIMNSTQLWTKTAPELGNRYGYGAVFRGSLNAAVNMSKYVKRVQDLGFQPADYVRKFSRPMAEGIRRNAAYAIPNELLNKLGDASMFLYTKLDTLNRAVGLATADVLANDLVKGSKAARQALNKMPASVRRQVNSLSDPTEIANVVGSHLNAATQYNYNNLSLSEFGRTMGPFFSTFSKWPTATAGEIIQEMREKGAIKGSTRNIEKFVVPLVMLQAADIMMTGYDPERPWKENQEEKTDRNKKLFGYSGLSQSAPIGAAESIIRGDFWTPPAIDAAVKAFVVPALEQDSGQLARGLDSALQNFAPGSVFVRFLTDDLVTLVTGERPEGSTFVERTASGLDRINKGN